MTTIIAASISTPGGGSLNIASPSGSGITVAEGGWSVGNVQQTVTVAKSMWVDGEQPTAIVKQNAKASLKLLIESDTHDGVSALFSQLIAAINQFSFVLTLQLDDVVYKWTCYRADYSVGFVRQFLFNHTCPVTVAFQRNPIPLAGPV